MRAESRNRLAESQAELIRSLALEQPAPDGFDPSRFEAAADAFMNKRARSIAHAWPALARALGESFNQTFIEYARSSRIQPAGDALADGHAFARALNRAGKLPDEGKIEMLATDARYVSSANGLIARRKWAIKAALFKRQRRIAIVIRLPLLGERWVNLRLGGH